MNNPPNTTQPPEENAPFVPVPPPVVQTYDTYGRPTVMTKEIVHLLEIAYSYDATDIQACKFAGIGRTTLHNYKIKNPEFVNRIEDLRSNYLLKSKQTLLGGIQGYVEELDANGKIVKVTMQRDPRLALDYMKLKMHKELKAGIDLTGTVKFDKSKRDSILKRWFGAEGSPIPPEALEGIDTEEI